MKTENFRLKLKRGLFAGVSVLALAAVGCGGGGGGTLVGAPVLQVGNGAGANPSIGRVRSALGTVSTTETPVLEAYSVAGNFIETIPVTTFPVNVTLDGDLKTAAEANGSLVFRLRNATGTKDYVTVSKVSTADLATNGTITEDGAVRTEDADAGATFRTALIESELESALGQPVTLGRKLAPEVQTQLSNVVSKTSTTAVAVDELAASLKTATKTTTTLLGQLASTVAADLDNSSTVSPKEAIKAFVKTGKNKTKTGAGSVASTAVLARLKKARGVLKASAKLSKQIRRLNSQTTTNTKAAARVAKVQEFLASLASTNEANANVAASGANVVASALDLSEKNAAVDTAADSLFATGVDINSAATQAADNVLPTIQTETANLAASGALNEVADVVGGVIAAVTDAVVTGNTSATKQAEYQNAFKEVVKAAVAVATGDDKNKVLGRALAATSSNKEGAKEVIAIASDSTVDIRIKDVIASVVSDETVDTGAMVSTVVDAVDELDSSLAEVAFGGNTNITDVVADLATVEGLSGEVVSAVVAENTSLDFTALEAALGGTAKIAGDASRTAKTGELFTVFNNSVELSTTVTYGYSWTVPATVGTVVESNSEYVTVQATGTANTGTITLTQTQAGVTNGTATVSVTVQSQLNPIATLAPKLVVLKQGSTGTIAVSAFDPEGQTVTGSVALDNPVTDVAVSLNTAGNLVTVAVGNNAPAGLYNATYTATAGTRSGTARFKVQVVALADTRLLLSGVTGLELVNGTVTSNVSVTAVQEKAITTATTLTLTVGSTGGTLATTSKAITATGVSSLGLSFTTTIAGNYAVTATVTDSTGTVSSASRQFNVKAANAPTILGLTGLGRSIANGDVIVIKSANTSNSVALSVSATGTGISTYGVTATQAGQTDVTASSSSGTLSVSLPATGTWSFTVYAQNANGSDGRVFTLRIDPLKEITVSSLSLGSTLTATSVPGALEADASGVTGLDLNNTNGLVFNLTSSTLVNTVNNTSGIKFNVLLTDPTNSVRNASLTVDGSTLVVTGGGYDVSSATGLLFEGTKSNGDQASVSVNSSAISNFDTLFTAATNGINLDISAMKNAMISILSQSGRTDFASQMENLQGSGLTLRVTVTDPAGNLRFKYGTKVFSTFIIKNITVN